MVSPEPLMEGGRIEPPTVPIPEPPRLGLSMGEAAESLGVSPDYFREHIAPEIRLVRRGRRRLIAVKELEWGPEESARRALEDQSRRG